ncbi:MAG TPA: DUF4407 domain-containing protein [Chthoniobacterales bacterium]
MQPYTYSRPASAKHVFFWLSGAGTETLEACPNWEQRKYVAFGATVLVPCLFAFIACSYALSTLTNNYAVVFPVAAVWAFIILTIDRALLASYRPFLSFWRKVGQFLLRFVVAFLMGLTIAHPLVLLLFRDTITTVIEKDRQAEIEQLHTSYSKGRAAAGERIATVEKSIAEQRLRWNETFQAQFKVDPASEKVAIPGLTSNQQAQLDKAVSDATAPAKQSLGAIEQQIATLTPQYTKLQQELAFWQSEFEREVNGQRSGIIGLGPRARSVQDDQLAWRREEVKRLGGLLEHFSAEKAALETQVRQAETTATQSFQGKLAEEQARQTAEEQRVAGLKHRVEADQASQFVTQQNQLRETIKTQIDARIGDLKFAQNELARIAGEEQRRVDILRVEPRRDILTQTLALHRLFKTGDEGGRFAYATYLVLTLLFVLVDTIPLMLKFFCKPGPYDTLLDRDEVRFDSEHQAFLVSHRQYMDQLAAGNSLAITRNKPLEEALIDGVEHTRAAREFLDSLIELERTFHEKLLFEQAAAENGKPEKLAVLEAMKKRFYDDLHYRIESFFTNRGRAEA